MVNKYINIYNNLIKLTRNKKIFQNLSIEESFSDRIVVLFFHFALFLKEYKNTTTKKEMQNLHDFFFKQIELSIREIGYGDASINKKMKDYINLFFFIIDKIDNWENLKNNEKEELLSNLININNNTVFIKEYFEKYIIYLKNNTFNYFTKDVIKFNF